MNISGIEFHPAIILAALGGIVWMVRLEGRINQGVKDNERLEDDIKRVEKESSKTNEETLKAVKELQKSVTELNVEIVRVIAEIKHITMTEK